VPAALPFPACGEKVRVGTAHRSRACPNFGAKAGSKSATVDFDVCAFAQPASGVSFMTIAMIALRTAATLSESFLDSAKPANVKQLSA